MSHLVKRWIPTLIAIVSGLVTLGGYLIQNPALVYFRVHLVEWAVIVSGFAFFLGLLNILRVHGRQIVRRRQGWFYSMTLLFAILLGLLPTVLSALPSLPASVPSQEEVDHVVFDFIISPLGGSLAALLVFTLTLGAFRLLRVRRSIGAVFFLLIVVVILLGSVPIVGLERLAGARDWIINVPGMAGMRGLLLGVALGTVITALRVFLASERPHSEF
jgi:hypothetical protein